MAKQINIRLSDDDYERFTIIRNKLYSNRVTDSSFGLELLLSAIENYQSRIVNNQLVDDLDIRLHSIEARLEALELNYLRKDSIESIASLETNLSIESVEILESTTDKDNGVNLKPITLTYDMSVDKIKKLNNEGRTLADIASILTEDKYPTKTGKTHWQSSQVSRILKS